jgi:hypothetical protein
MELCETCKFYDPQCSKACSCPKMLYGYGTSRKSNDEVEIEDDEGWGMIPGPKFGCIHHESIIILG